LEAVTALSDALFDVFADRQGSREWLDVPARLEMALQRHGHPDPVRQLARKLFFFLIPEVPDGNADPLRPTGPSSDATPDGGINPFHR
jgi:hypothetical protein